MGALSKCCLINKTEHISHTGHFESREKLHSKSSFSQTQQNKRKSAQKKFPYKFRFKQWSERREVSQISLNRIISGLFKEFRISKAAKDFYKTINNICLQKQGFVYGVTQLKKIRDYISTACKKFFVFFGGRGRGNTMKIALRKAEIDTKNALREKVKESLSYQAYTQKLTNGIKGSDKNTSSSLTLSTLNEKYLSYRKVLFSELKKSRYKQPEKRFFEKLIRKYSYEIVCDVKRLIYEDKRYAVCFKAVREIAKHSLSHGICPTSIIQWFYNSLERKNIKSSNRKCFDPDYHLKVIKERIQVEFFEAYYSGNEHFISVSITKSKKSVFDYFEREVLFSGFHMKSIEGLMKPTTIKKQKEKALENEKLDDEYEKAMRESGNRIIFADYGKGNCTKEEFLKILDNGTL